MKKLSCVTPGRKVLRIEFILIFLSASLFSNVSNATTATVYTEPRKVWKVGGFPTSVGHGEHSSATAVCDYIYATRWGGDSNPPYESLIPDPDDTIGTVSCKGVDEDGNITNGAKGGRAIEHELCPNGYSLNDGTCFKEIDLTVDNQGDAAEDDDPCNSAGNPIRISDGSKYQVETDYKGNGEFPLELIRYFNTGSNNGWRGNSVTSGNYAVSGYSHTYTDFWTETYSRRLSTQVTCKHVANIDGELIVHTWPMKYYLEPTADGESVIELPLENLPNVCNSTLNAYSRETLLLIRDNGSTINLERIGQNWVSVFGNGFSVQETIDEDNNVESYIITTPEKYIETYNKYGTLQSVTHPNGRQHTLSYRTSEGLSAPFNRPSIAKIADDSGREIVFHYETLEDVRYTSITLPDGGTIQYGYQSSDADSSRYLFKEVTYPSKQGEPPHKKTYRYGETGTASPYALTSIEDERGITYANWDYDYLKGTMSSHADGFEQVNFNRVYDNDGKLESVTLTNALGKQTQYEFESINGVQKVKKVTGVASQNCLAANSEYTYDNDARIKTKTDWNGNITEYWYNDSLSKIEKIARQVSATEFLTTYEVTQWDSNLPKPTTILRPNKTVTLEYENGRIKKRTETDTSQQSVPYTTNGTQREWNYLYSYHPNTNIVQTLSLNGPRPAWDHDNDANTPDQDDITVYHHDSSGNLTQIDFANGSNRQFLNHNGRGLPSQITDENGTQRNLSYHPRGWLEKIETLENGNTHILEISYDAIGQVKKITQPDGSYLEYQYNAARYLTQISNSLGETIQFTDTANGINLNKLNGQWQTEWTQDSSDVDQRIRNRTFDELGRVLTLLGNDDQLVKYEYDDNSNLKKIIQGSKTENENNNSANNVETQYHYDRLNRLESKTDDLGNTTQYQYDDQGNLTQVTAPNGAVTQYIYDGFGRKIQQISPDTGTTTYYYDLADNLIKTVDSLNTTIEYRYDVLNRLTKIDFPADTDVVYSYDNNSAGDYGMGRLHQVTDASGTTTYRYDYQGNIKTVDYILAGQAYGLVYRYDNANRLAEMVYPSGRVIQYGRDAFGQINQIIAKENDTATAPSTTLLSAVQHKPFGPTQQFDLANQLNVSRDYDTDYRIESINTPDIHALSYDYDVFDNITALSNNIEADHSETFDYDNLHRLSSAAGIYGSISYQYDSVGNRTHRSITDEGYTLSETYTTSPNNNRLDSIQIDDNGQVRTRDLSYLASGQINADINKNPGEIYNYTYNENQRLTNVSLNGTEVASYTYNAFGQRVIKNADETRHYHYDQQGQLIAETDEDGQILQEYVYLNGLLVAALTTESNSWEIIDPATSLSEGIVAVSAGKARLIPQDKDEKHYLKAIDGDVTLVSQIAQLRKTQGVGKVGLVLSESPSSDAIQLKISVVTENHLIPIKRKAQFIPVLKEKSRALEISYRSTTGGNFTTETYAYQGDWLKLDRQGDQIEVLTSSDGNQWTSVQSLNLIMASESYIGFSGENSAAVDLNNISLQQSGLPIPEWVYVHTDHLGTPKLVTQSSQHIVWQADAKPFGENQIGNETISQFIRFPGQYFDGESGLHYNYFRDYDPSLGRYIESDPIGLAGGLNTYAYVGGNPLSYTDPYGLWANIAVGVGVRVVGVRVVGGRAAGAAISRGLQNTVGRGAGRVLSCLLIGYCSEAADDAGEDSSEEGDDAFEDEAGEDSGSESCPSNDEDNWEKIPGSNQAYRPKGGKEPIFEKDRAGGQSHGGSKWKKWDKKRDWEKGRPRNGTYDSNGNRLRE